MKKQDKIQVFLHNEIKNVKKEYVYINFDMAQLKMKYKFRKTKKGKEHRCFWCGKIIVDKEDCTIDHVLPQSGFSERYKAWKTNNMVISCKRCNQSKSNILPNKNIDITYKSQIIKRKTIKKIHLKQQKISNFLSSKEDNVMELAKRDSPYYNVKMFFSGKRYIKY